MHPLKLLSVSRSDSWMGLKALEPWTWQIWLGWGGLLEELGAALETELTPELAADETEPELAAELGAELAAELATELAALPDDEATTLAGSDRWLGSRPMLLPTLEMEPKLKLDAGTALLSFDDRGLHFLAEANPTDAVSVNRRGRRMLHRMRCCRWRFFLLPPARRLLFSRSGHSASYCPQRRCCGSTERLLVCNKHRHGSRRKSRYCKVPC